MGILSFLGVLSPVHMVWIRAWTGARLVGTDQHGNRYYEAKPRPGYSFTRRTVRYKGAPEASLVPPEWHGWLHHQSDALPDVQSSPYRKPWMKPHQPNMTGTTGAYRPPGHVLAGGQRDRATGDYEAWTPPQ